MIIDLLDRPRVPVVYQNREIRDVLGEHRQQIESNSWVIVNAVRPIPGEITWRGQISRGVFYAAGPREKYAETWKDLDGWEVVEITNEDVVRFFRDLVERKAGLIDWNDIEEMGIGPLAERYRLPWKCDDNEAVEMLKVSGVRETSHPGAVPA
jgi:hypothetical protein